MNIDTVFCNTLFLYFLISCCHCSSHSRRLKLPCASRNSPPRAVQHGSVGHSVWAEAGHSAARYQARLHSHFSSTHTLYPLSSQWWPRCPCVGRGRQLELFHRRTSSVVKGNIEHTSHWRSSLIPRDTRLQFRSCLQVNFYNIIYMSLCIAFGFSPWQEITLVAWQQECC